ncbi:hypothetical protein L917_10550 [Phytophthora nicotianae]|uniref:Uncharacterized protein n=1 Tax=Phytophthora nicotianae TaxID=4792 RepID=W2L2J8_PHYNI|nr:hypothetical protein L917_10550 [Phytophthora nicotianae]
MCWKIVFAAQDEKANTSSDVASAEQKGTLLNFHKCLEHLNFDAVKRLARDRSSCIERIVHKNVNRLISAQGKKTKNKQSSKGTGEHSRSL